MERKTVSLILKAIVVVCAVCGTVISALAGRNTFMGGNRPLTRALMFLNALLFASSRSSRKLHGFMFISVFMC